MCFFFFFFLTVRSFWSLSKSLHLNQYRAVIMAKVIHTRCACARGAPQSLRHAHAKVAALDADTMWLIHAAFEDDCLWEQKYMYSAFNFSFHKLCLILKKKIGFSFDFLQTFRKDSSCRIDQIKYRNEPAWSLQGCISVWDVHMPWRSAKLQACMKSAKPDTLDARARANNQNDPAQSGRPQPSWSERFEIRAMIDRSILSN